MKWMWNLITLIEHVVRLSLFSLLIASHLFHYPWQATFSAQHPVLHAWFFHMQCYKTGYSPSFHKLRALAGAGGVPTQTCSLGAYTVASVSCYSETKTKIWRVSEDINGSISEPAHDYLCYYRHYSYLLYWLFGGVGNSFYVDFSCSASCSNSEQYKNLPQDSVQRLNG